MLENTESEISKSNLKARVREKFEFFGRPLPFSNDMPHHTHEFSFSSKKRKAQHKSSSISKNKSKMSSDSNVDSEGEFHIVKASIRLSVPPIFANSPRAGIEEMLDSMTMRYILYHILYLIQ